MTGSAESNYDAIVVGGGIGGLFAAASVAKHGGKVLVLERLPRLGGRFTTRTAKGIELTTGALHFAPHGSGGPFAALLRQLGTNPRFVEPDVFASFYCDGKHMVAKKFYHVLRLFTLRGKADLFRIISKIKFFRDAPDTSSFAEWLHSQTRDKRIHQVFERFIQFALSIRPDQISYREMRAVFKSVVQYGVAAAPEGGCRKVIEDLTALIISRGGQVITRAGVSAITLDGLSGRVSGVTYRDPRRGIEIDAAANVVVSDIGPEATQGLLKNGWPPALEIPLDGEGASGLKVHLLSDKSLVGHKGIMFCLDTARICGLVQVTNSVPGLTPPGQHMIDTFQILQGNDLKQEKALALEDLSYIFGDDFRRHCTVAGISAYRKGWPVNRLIQGTDLNDQMPIPGLIMVGDAYKPSGSIMVEGVAGSVQAVENQLIAAATGDL